VHYLSLGSRTGTTHGDNIEHNGLCNQQQYAINAIKMHSPSSFWLVFFQKQPKLPSSIEKFQSH